MVKYTTLEDIYKSLNLAPYRYYISYESPGIFFEEDKSEEGDRKDNRIKKIKRIEVDELLRVGRVIPKREDLTLAFYKGVLKISYAGEDANELLKTLERFNPQLTLFNPLENFFCRVREVLLELEGHNENIVFETEIKNERIPNLKNLKTSLERIIEAYIGLESE